MTPELKAFAKTIERLITEAGVKLPSNKARQLEQCLILGYLHGAKDAGKEQPYLTILASCGRRLTDEARRAEREEAQKEAQ